MKVVSVFKLLGVTIDKKLNFEKHISKDSILQNIHILGASKNMQQILSLTI